MLRNCAPSRKTCWRLHTDQMTENIENLKQQSIKEYNRRKYDAAIEGFRTCLQIYENQGDELLVAEMRNNLSVALLGKKAAQEAYDIVKGTDEVFQKVADLKRQGMALANTAAALEALDRKEEALALYERTLGIFKEAGEKELRVNILRRISDLQLKTKRGFQAIASMEAAYDQGEKPSLKNSVLKTTLAAIRKKFIK